MNVPHLTDDQFAECLDGEYPSPETQAHLAACEACSAELTLFQSSVEDFSTMALDWSKAQPVVSPRAQAHSHTAGSWFAPLQWAAAAVLVLAVGIPLALRHGSPPTEAVQDDSPAEIAQDNTLLQSVNVALGSNDPSPLAEYRLNAASPKIWKPRPESRNE